MGVVYLAYNTGTPIVSGSTIPMNTIIRRRCSNVGTDMVLRTNGYYKITVDANLTLDSTAGTATITINQNGVAIPGATATVSVAASGSTHISLSTVVRNSCYNDTSIITITYSGATLTATSATVIIENA